MMDEVVPDSIKDTESADQGQTLDASLVRAILDATPADVKRLGFIACSLRYDLTLENGSIVSVGPLISHESGDGGYDDDSDTVRRLGGNDALGTRLQKEMFESLLAPWFEFTVLGLERSATGFAELRKRVDREFAVAGTDPAKPETLHVLNGALSKLVPEGVRRRKKGIGPRDPPLSMKVDIFTNRTGPGWHKDSDRGHALIVGLLNISDGPIASTELCFDPQINAPSELMAMARGEVRSASPRRGEILALIQKGDGENIKNLRKRCCWFNEQVAQRVGELRWFNDAFWIHRTPPLAGFGYGFDETPESFGIERERLDLPADIVEQSTHEHLRYQPGTHELQPMSRMLVRITLRDMFHRVTEAWVDVVADRVFVRNTAKRVSWFARNLRSEDFREWTDLTDALYDPVLEEGGKWYVRSLELSSFEDGNWEFAYECPPGSTRKRVPDVVIKR